MSGVCRGVCRDLAGRQRGDDAQVLVAMMDASIPELSHEHFPSR